MFDTVKICLRIARPNKTEPRRTVYVPFITFLAYFYFHFEHSSLPVRIGFIDHIRREHFPSIVRIITNGDPPRSVSVSRRKFMTFSVLCQCTIHERTHKKTATINISQKHWLCRYFRFAPMLFSVVKSQFRRKSEKKKPNGGRILFRKCYYEINFETISLYICLKLP